jgi:serine protease Do
VFRRGLTRDLNVAVAEIEPERTRRAAAPENKPVPAAGAATSSLGLTLANLSDDQKRELKVKGGVRVEAVDGAAVRAGLREGDVLLAVGNVDISDTKQFEAALAKLDKTKPINVLFRRGDWAQYALIRPVK